MGKNAEEIVIAANGAISLGQVESDYPVDPTAALADGQTDLGYATEDGVTFNVSPEILRTMSWQSSSPTRMGVTNRAATVAFQLQQWNDENFALAFGGGEWVEEETGLYRFDPPADTDSLAEHQLVIDWADGDRHWRHVSHRISVTEAVEVNLVRTAESVLAVTGEILSPPEGITRPWNIYSDDPAFAPAS